MRLELLFTNFPSREGGEIAYGREGSGVCCDLQWLRDFRVSSRAGEGEKRTQGWGGGRFLAAICGLAEEEVKGVVWNCCCFEEKYGLGRVCLGVVLDRGNCMGLLYVVGRCCCYIRWELLEC